MELLERVRQHHETMMRIIPSLSRDLSILPQLPQLLNGESSRPVPVQISPGPLTVPNRLVRHVENSREGLVGLAYGAGESVEIGAGRDKLMIRYRIGPHSNGNLCQEIGQSVNLHELQDQGYYGPSINCALLNAKHGQLTNTFDVMYEGERDRVYFYPEIRYQQTWVMGQRILAVFADVTATHVIDQETNPPSYLAAIEADAAERRGDALPAEMVELTRKLYSIVADTIEERALAVNAQQL